jgi:16S rRNA (cytosine1407-C5)-methyltransferase
MTKKKKSKQIIGVLPEKFEARLIELIPNTVTQLEIKKTFIRRPTTFRVNTLKSTLSKVKKELQTNGFKVSQPVWSSIAFQLDNLSKRDLMELDIYKNGEIYIQSFASQLPPVVLDVKPNHLVLDLTAAPGSKTSQLSAMMQNKSQIVANDCNKVRFFKLKHNLENLGVTNATLKLEDGSRLAGFTDYENYFDRILLDAPCSAEARFVIGEIKTFGFWSEPKVKAMAKKQRKLLFSAWRALKPGGILVYSTCTISPEENELMIDKFMQKHDNVKLVPIEIDGVKKLEISEQWRTKTINPEIIKKTFRIKPSLNTEGFYVAKLQKTQ